MDADGNVFLAEIRKPRIRRVDARTGLVHIVAGSGVRGVSDVSGSARLLGFEQPAALALDGKAALLVADGSHIWRVDLSSGRMEAWAPALRVSIRPHGLALAPGGGLLFTDDYGVRRIEPGGTAVVPVAGFGQGF